MNLISKPSPNHSARSLPILCIVMHATAGNMPGTLSWLTSPRSRVSSHYLITRDGTIYMLVPDERVAWHAGESAWYDLPQQHGSLNGCSIGIELENLNTGTDPYPVAQLTAATQLSRQLVRQYQIPRRDFVRHLDISPGRKTDPAGFPWTDFVNGVYHEETPSTRIAILGGNTTDATRAAAYINSRRLSGINGYSADDVTAICERYMHVCNDVQLDMAVAIGQMIHETGSLTSFWSARPQRNPAGIGVTGQVFAEKPDDTPAAYNTQRHRWEAGLSFPNWADSAIPAHIGRLLAYCLTDEQIANDAAAASGYPLAIRDVARRRARLVQYALLWRPLPDRIRGSATYVDDLGGVWAVDSGYGERVAVHIRALQAEV